MLQLKARELLCCTQAEDGAGWVKPLPARQIERIFDFTGGHPYFLQWLGHRLVKALEGRGDRMRDKHFDAAVADFLQNTGVHGAFADDYSKLSPLQRRVLTALCQQPGESLTTAELVEITGQPRDSIRATGSQLAQFGYLYPEQIGRTPAESRPFRLRFRFYRDLIPAVEPRSRLTEADVARSRLEHRQKPTVVFVYSQKDERELGAFTQILTPSLSSHNLVLWNELQLDDRGYAQTTLREVVQRASLVVVLVSPDFLASAVLTGRAVPLLLCGDGNGSTRRLYPLFVRPALLPHAPPGGSLLAALGTLKGLNSPAAPLSLLTDAHREEELVRLAKLLVAELDKFPPQELL